MSITQLVRPLQLPRQGGSYPSNPDACPVGMCDLCQPQPLIIEVLPLASDPPDPDQLDRNILAERWEYARQASRYRTVPPSAHSLTYAWDEPNPDY